MSNPPNGYSLRCADLEAELHKCRHALKQIAGLDKACPVEWAWLIAFDALIDPDEGAT